MPLATRACQLFNLGATVTESADVEAVRQNEDTPTPDGVNDNRSRPEEAGQAHFSRLSDAKSFRESSKSYGSCWKNEPVPGRERLRVNVGPANSQVQQMTCPGRLATWSVGEPTQFCGIKIDPRITRMYANESRIPHFRLRQFA